MHKTRAEAADLANALAASVGSYQQADVVLCPPVTSLESVGNAINGTRIKLGAQNCYFEDQGAFTATISAMDQTIEQHAAYDLDAGLMSLTMTLPGFFDDSMEVSAIVDLENEVIYLDASLFEEMGLEVDTTWLRIDREALEEAGQDASGFDQFKTGDPTGLAGALVDVGEVTEIGKETIDGEELMHYQVVADTADLLDADPEALEQLEVQVEQFGGELPDEVVYDVWVTEDNRVRRMVIDLEMGVMQASVEYVFEDLDGPVEIELPADDDVTDIMDLV